MSEYHDPGEEWERMHPYHVECKKHGSGDYSIDECPKCMEEDDMLSRENEGPHGLCSGCDHADFERSNLWYTWCTGWKDAGFPVRPRKKRCAKFTPIMDSCPDGFMDEPEYEDGMEDWDHDDDGDGHFTVDDSYADERDHEQEDDES